MGYPVKIQRVQRTGACSYYVNFPVAVAESIGATKGETWCWSLEDKDTLVLQRQEAAAPTTTRNGRRRREQRETVKGKGERGPAVESPKSKVEGRK